MFTIPKWVVYCCFTHSFAGLFSYIVDITTALASATCPKITMFAALARHCLPFSFTIWVSLCQVIVYTYIIACRYIVYVCLILCTHAHIHTYMHGNTHTSILYIYMHVTIYIYNTNIQYLYMLCTSTHLIFPFHCRATTRMGFNKTYLRDQKIFIFPALVQCFGPFMQFSNLVVFESPGPPVLSLGPLVPWSSGPLVLWSLGPLVLLSLGPLVLWSFGPPVPWSSCLLVPWSFRPLVTLVP